MIVQVIIPYFDLKAENTLRLKGQILNIVDKKRAEELINKGLIKEVEIIEVKEAEEVKEEDVTVAEKATVEEKTEVKKETKTTKKSE